MKRISWLIILVMVVSVGVALSTRQADLLYSNKVTRLQEVIAAHIDSPRDTYNIIMKAYHQGMAPEATMIYHTWMKGRPGDANMEAAYAFSHYWAAGNNSDLTLTEAQQKSPLRVSLFKQYAEAEQCRVAALEAAPDSPEILVETAIGMFNKYSYLPPMTPMIHSLLLLLLQDFYHRDTEDSEWQSRNQAKRFHHRGHR